jgi:hypothetical protein
LFGTIKRINHLADINGTDNLRRIAKRLPDRLMKKENRDEEQTRYELYDTDESDEEEFDEQNTLRTKSG